MRWTGRAIPSEPTRCRGGIVLAWRRPRRSSRSPVARSRSRTRRRSTSPTPAYTKLDLVHYYLAVADGALRACAAGRWRSSGSSTGSPKEPFFQKRAPDNTPDWIRTAELTFPSGRTADEIVVDDAAGLAWVVNLGCIDLNPHPVRADDLDHPDELRIDLDPVPGVPWPQIREVALVARRRSRPSGLVGWPKTSGSRGIHINVRIERAGPTRRSAAPRWPWPATSSARARTRHLQVVEGGAPRRLPRLQPERQGPHGRLGLLGPAAARRARLDAADAGTRSRRRGGGVHDRDGAGAVRRAIGDPGAGIDEAVGSLEALLELSARARGRGPGRRPVAAELRQAGRRAAAGPAVAQAAPGLGVRPGRGEAGGPPPEVAAERAAAVAAGDRTPGCRPSGRARARRRPDAARRTSRSSRSPVPRRRPRRSTVSSAGRRATPRRPGPSSRRTSWSMGCAAGHRSGTGSGSTSSTCRRPSGRRRSRSIRTTTRGPARKRLARPVRSARARPEEEGDRLHAPPPRWRSAPTPPPLPASGPRPAATPSR